MKLKLITKLKENLLYKISVLENMLFEAHESQKNDTKSSAGDKFETGR